MGPQGRAAGEGASERPEGEADAVSCDSVPEDSLAWVAGTPCGSVLRAEAGVLQLESTQVGRELTWSSAPPRACAANACSYELFVDGEAIFVLAIQARPGGAVPEQLWLAGAAIAPAAEGEPTFLPLWGGERVRVDSSDFGPAYELRPHLCAGVLRLELGTREPAAALSDAPEGMRALLDEVGSVSDESDCHLVAGVSR